MSWICAGMSMWSSATAALHWVTNHERVFERLAQALCPAGVLEVQCGGTGNIRRVREVIDRVAGDRAPDPAGWSPWVFAGSPAAVDTTSIFAAHLARLPEDQRDPFAAAVVAGIKLPLDYVRLDISVVRL